MSKVIWLVSLFLGHGGLMVGAHDSGLSGLGSIPGREHCDVFLGKTLNFHSPRLHPGVQMVDGR